MTTTTIAAPQSLPGGATANPYLNVVTTHPAPDLVAVLNSGIVAVAEFKYFDVAASRKEDPAGFTAVFEWARAQEFEPGHAERMRREAWSAPSE